MDLIIRAGRGDDWAAIERVFVAAGHAAWMHILSTEALATLTPPTRWHPEAGAHMLLAECADKRIVGFVCTRASADDDATAKVAEIDAFYVHPSVWGRGVGRALIAAATRHLAASGFTEATLWTEHRNHRPLRFYRAAGWRLDGRERQRSFHGSDLVELRHRTALIST